MAKASELPSEEPPKAIQWQRNVFKAVGRKIPKNWTEAKAAKSIEALTCDPKKKALVAYVKENGLPDFEEILGTISTTHLRSRLDDVCASLAKDSYTVSYEHFIQYFENLETISLHNLIIGANFSYAWMPSILEFKANVDKSSVEILQAARQEKRLPVSELEPLVKLIDNSIVGASKLLHFVNPEVYAIWDSRVCQCISGRNNFDYYNRLNRYGSYLEACSKLSKSNDFDDIWSEVQRSTGYPITRFRAVELIFFMAPTKPIVEDVIMNKI